MSDNKKPTDYRDRWDDLRREREALENEDSRKASATTIRACSIKRPRSPPTTR